MDGDDTRDGGEGSASLPTLPVGADDEPLAVGELVGGRYRALRWLGRGGMGSVYEVEDCELGMRVALKIAEGIGWDTRAVAQLKREIMLARRVTHPNVCRVHDFGMQVLPDGRSAPFLTMELIEGRTLAAELAERGRLDPDEVLRVAEPMAAALDAAHAAGVVHRDFKTGNVMIVGDRTVVTDFGLAIDAAHDESDVSALVGSPAYMAPEQVEGRAVTVATDVYAFGVVLYELVTGHLPFTGENAISIAVQRLSVAPRTPRSVIPTLAPRWEDAILRCLRVAPHERFETCGDVVRALRTGAGSIGSVVTRAAPEQRSIALVVAHELHDEASFDAAILAHGGTRVALSPARPAGLFGAEHSRGDEIERALAAAHAASDAADRVVLAVGHATLRGGVLVGEAVHEAIGAVERGGEGVLAAANTASLIATRCEIVETEPGLYALGPRRPITSATLVGRDAELAILRRARDTALAESRMIATWIVGPPGIGKSRLAEAAVGLALEAGMRVTSARAAAHNPRAYALFSSPSDAATEANRAARVLASDTDAPLVHLSASLGRGNDAQAMSDRMRARVLGRLNELASSGPAALVLDDLQWTDPSSLALLEELPSVLGDAPLWLVLVAREELVEARPELAGIFESVGRIEPGVLRAADVTELVRARTGAAPRPAIAQALADRTGGNPLFVEQLLAVLDPSVLEGEAIDEWPLPATVEHAVQAHLDQLPLRERECVKLLSIFGRPAAASELEALARAEMREPLSALARRALVTRAGGGAHRLRSPVVGEVAYRLIDDARRRELHAIAAEIVVGRDAEEVARHLEAAGDAARARAAYVRATLENAVRGDSRGVLRCATRAIEHGLAPEEAFAVHFARSEAARFVGDPAMQKALLAEAWTAARDDRERALVASEEGEWFRRNRRPSEALAHLTRAVELARASGDEETRARAIARRVSTLITMGRTDDARATIAELDAALPSSGPATRAIVEDVRGWLAGSVGDYGAVRAAYASAAKLYAEAGDLRRAAGAESNLADADNRLGRYEEAQQALRRGLEHARKVGNRLTEGYALMNLGYALTEGGRVESALKALEDALRIARSIGDSHLELGARLYAARARLAKGDAVAEELEAIAREASGDPTLEANARSLAARAWLATGEAERARNAALTALVIRDSRGAIEEGEGDVFFAAALALEACGEIDRAKDTRRRGRERVHELADRIADPDARQSFVERVPAHRFLAADV